MGDYVQLLHDHSEQIAVLENELKAMRAEISESKQRERHLELAVNRQAVVMAQWGVILSALVFVAGTVTTIAVKTSFDSVKSAIAQSQNHSSK